MRKKSAQHEGGDEALRVSCLILVSLPLCVDMLEFSGMALARWHCGCVPCLVFSGRHATQPIPEIERSVGLRGRADAEQGSLPGTAAPSGDPKHVQWKSVRYDSTSLEL
eukprot:6471826-Amphidinium_carterae.2